MNYKLCKVISNIKSLLSVKKSILMKYKYYKSTIDFKDKVILITGGTGTFGQALASKPSKITILVKLSYFLETNSSNMKWRNILEVLVLKN